MTAERKERFLAKNVPDEKDWATIRYTKLQIDPADDKVKPIEVTRKIPFTQAEAEALERIYLLAENDEFRAEARRASGIERDYLWTHRIAWGDQLQDRAKTFNGMRVAAKQIDRALLSSYNSQNTMRIIEGIREEITPFISNLGTSRRRVMKNNEQPR